MKKINFLLALTFCIIYSYALQSQTNKKNAVGTQIKSDQMQLISFDMGDFVHFEFKDLTTSKTYSLSDVSKKADGPTREMIDQIVNACGGEQCPFTNEIFKVTLVYELVDNVDMNGNQQGKKQKALTIMRLSR